MVLAYATLGTEGGVGDVVALQQDAYGHAEGLTCRINV